MPPLVAGGGTDIGGGRGCGEGEGGGAIDVTPAAAPLVAAGGPGRDSAARSSTIVSYVDIWNRLGKLSRVEVKGESVWDV